MVRLNSLERETIYVLGVAEDFCQATEYLNLSSSKVFEISALAWY